jgi:outer membrane protein TolC
VRAIRWRGWCALASASAVLYACRSIPPEPLAPERSAAALTARTLADPGLRDFLEANLGRATEPWPAQRWDLTGLTLAALYYQPGLDVSRAVWAGVDASIETAAGLPNPALSIAPEFTSNAAKGVNPWLASIHLDWMIETAGKREHRIRRARALSTAQRYVLAGEVWRVRSNLRNALLDLAAARARLAELSDEVTAQQELVALLEQRVTAGAASAAELSLPRLALIQSAADRADVRRQELVALARLAEEVGVPSRALEEVEIDFPLEEEGADLLDLPAEEAQRRALYARSDVLAALARYAASEDALRLELARQYPDLHVGSGYQFDQGQNKWAIGATIELPVLNRNHGPIAEAEAARAEAAARFVALQAAVLAEIERALANRRGAGEQVARLESLVGERRDALERAQSGLALGAFDRLSVVAAQVELARGRIALVDARVALQRALGDLDTAVQGRLVGAEAIERSERPLPGSGPS